MNETSSPDPHEEDAFVRGNDEKPPPLLMTRWVPDKNFPLTIPNYRYVKLKLETEILARQLKPRYFLLEVAKAIAGPVAVLGLMWTIVVGISQQGALQQSKEDERFDKAVTRLAGPSPTERLTRCGPSVAPTPPANSRNFVPSPPTANPVRARFPVDCSATTAPVEELRLRSSSILWLRSCLGPVARAPPSACARR